MKMMSSKEDIAFQKMALMFKARKAVEAISELEDAAQEVLLLHPGCDKDQWLYILTNQYRTEIVDAYGRNIDTLKLSRELDKLWNKVQKNE